MASACVDCRSRMLAESFEAFASASEALFRASPDHTRFVVKYRHKEGRLVLRCTDDRACLTFHTDQMQDLKRLDALSRILMGVCMDGEAVPEYVEPVQPSQHHNEQKHAGGKSKKKRR